MDIESNSSKRAPNEDDKMRAVDLLINRLNQAFVLYFWVRTVRPMLTTHPKFKDEHFKIETVKNACVHSTLICVRDLDDFFATDKKTWESDVRAYDFLGYESPGRFLTDHERTTINHWVAHTTYHPIWTCKTGIAPDKNQDWDSVDLVGKATRIVCAFMEHLETEFSKKNSDEAESIKKIKMVFEYHLNKMENAVRDADSIEKS